MKASGPLSIPLLGLQVVDDGRSVSTPSDHLNNGVALEALVWSGSVPDITLG